MSQPPPTLKRLIYRSKAAGPFDLDALKALMVQSRNLNAVRDITGVLVFQDGYFMQALEGPIQEVDSLYRVIQGDPRHEDVTLIDQRPIQHRLFGDWSMELADYDRAIVHWAGLLHDPLPLHLVDVVDADSAYRVVGALADPPELLS